LPNRAPPLMREHRLYQADWLVRYYGFATAELTATMPAGQLDLVLDPKTVWALANRERFPVDVNTADRALLLRVPGLGVRVVKRILSTRRQRRLRYSDLEALGARLTRARYFIIAADYRPKSDGRGSERLRVEMTQAHRQQSLF
jgi:predicted DNA-binding helix-hairpin-helix protein